MSEQETAPAVAKKPWYKKKGGMIAIGVLAFLILVGILNPADTPTNQNNQQKTEQKKADAPTTAKIGQPATDGKFEFTVKSMECGATSVGTNPYMTKQAQGQYCLLAVSVKNTGDRPQSLFSTNQKVYNSDKQEYAADDVATMYASPNGQSWFSNINPGNTVEGTMVFDLPTDKKPVRAILKDNAFSSGVEVNLQ